MRNFLRVKTFTKTFLFSATLFGLALPVLAEDQQRDERRTGEQHQQEDRDARARMDAPADEQARLITRASDVYRAMVSGPQGQVPEDVLNQVRCVAIFPEVTSAALVVGGTRGDGIATCRTEGAQAGQTQTAAQRQQQQGQQAGAQEQNWSDLAFVNMTGGSLGVQVGATSSDVVLFIIDQEGEERLKEGRFTLGADTSVVAGEYDARWRTPEAGVVAYQRTGGAYIGASLHGFNITENEENMRAYYDRDVELARVLDGEERAEQTQVVQQFFAVLPEGDGQARAQLGTQRQDKETRDK